MKKVGAILVILAATLAGFLGGVMGGNWTEPEAVHAETPIKIGLLNLEDAARKSRAFAEKKIEWEKVQADIQESNRKAQADIDDLRKELRDAQLRSASPDDLRDRQIAIKAKEELLKVTEKAQQKWLSDLLDKYQQDVLEIVYDAAKEYCRKNGYHILLQDYSLDKSSDELFASRAWAQTLMSRPVLYAPYAAEKGSRRNVFVTDITEDVILSVK